MRYSCRFYASLAFFAQIRYFQVVPIIRGLSTDHTVEGTLSAVLPAIIDCWTECAGPVGPSEENLHAATPSPDGLVPRQTAGAAAQVSFQRTTETTRRAVVQSVPVATESAGPSDLERRVAGALRARGRRGDLPSQLPARRSDRQSSVAVVARRASHVSLLGSPRRSGTATTLSTTSIASDGRHGNMTYRPARQDDFFESELIRRGGRIAPMWASRSIQARSARFTPLGDTRINDPVGPSIPPHRLSHPFD